MADQPATTADLKIAIAALTASFDNLTAVITKSTNAFTELLRYDNPNRRRRGGRNNQIHVPVNIDYVRKPSPVKKLQQKLLEKDEVLPDKTEIIPIIAEPPPVPIEPLQEDNLVMTEIELSEPDLVPAIEIHDEVIIAPLEVKNVDIEEEVSVAIAPKTPNQTATTPAAYYPFELDEVSLRWKRSQRYPFEFGVNSRSSSFQVGVTDTDQFRSIFEVFKEFWKPGKCVRKKGKIKYQGNIRLAARRCSSRREHYISEDGSKLSKLDRLLVSSTFGNRWKNLGAKTLERKWSNRFPILLSDHRNNFGLTPFKWYNVWLREKKLEEIVKKSWEQDLPSRRPDCRFRDKLKRVKQELRI
ncbi:hypothetical protein OSB04_011345 [Centaurea solstitialis]|uniref:Uncharacterized protein n=1 Tax=Centaurea solstitialis TaxID=347529 RepID=A0AA38WQ08_9ASTR|nr:hypothetical protein OSB04_011345 [Centaurea solstitialis]